MALTRRLTIAALCLALLGLAALAAVYSVTRRGFSARDRPTLVEAAMARTMRQLGMPRGARAQINPTPDSPETIQAGLEHFADHCASCHANDGSGDAQIGRNLYPKAPDMRLASTQRLTDGELFYVIENGIRLTGMPAWGNGTTEGQHASWALVRFIRRLPQLSTDEVRQMEQLNPRAPVPKDEQQIEDDFLNGADLVPSPAPAPHKHGSVPRK